MPTEMLPVKLSQDELFQRGTELASQTEKLVAMKAEHKDQKAAMKRREDELEKSVKQLAKVRDSGYEDRPVEVTDTPDLERRVMVRIRRDDGTIVIERPMTENEVAEARQTKIPMTRMN